MSNCNNINIKLDVSDAQKRGLHYKSGWFFNLPVLQNFARTLTIIGYAVMFVVNITIIIITVYWITINFTSPMLGSALYWFGLCER